MKACSNVAPISSWRRPTHANRRTNGGWCTSPSKSPSLTLQRARRLQNKLFWNECVDGFGFQVGGSNDRCLHSRVRLRRQESRTHYLLGELNTSRVLSLLLHFNATASPL